MLKHFIRVRVSTNWRIRVRKRLKNYKTDDMHRGPTWTYPEVCVLRAFWPGFIYTCSDSKYVTAFQSSDFGWTVFKTASGFFWESRHIVFDLANWPEQSEKLWSCDNGLIGLWKALSYSVILGRSWRYDQTTSKLREETDRGPIESPPLITFPFPLPSLLRP